MKQFGINHNNFDALIIVNLADFKVFSMNFLLLELKHQTLTLIGFILLKLITINTLQLQLSSS